MAKDLDGSTFSDGSSINGHTAAIIIKEKFYFGPTAKVMDAEMLGLAMAWRHHNQVAMESQGTIVRIMEMRFTGPRSWVEELAINAHEDSKKEIRGHSGVIGNGFADFQA